MKRLGRMMIAVTLVLALWEGAAATARAQLVGYPVGPYGYPATVYGGWGGVSPGFGYGGLGYGGLGYGGLGYGGLGYGGLGYGGYGYGGYGGFGIGYPGYGYGFGYPAYGYGYGGLGYGYGGFGYGGYGYPTIPTGLFNPLFGVGLTPLAVQSAVTERYVLGRGRLIDRTPATSSTTQGSTVRQFDYYRSP
jgi:hypothetical protein